MWCYIDFAFCTRIYICCAICLPVAERDSVTFCFVCFWWFLSNFFVNFKYGTGTCESRIRILNDDPIFRIQNVRMWIRINITLTFLLSSVAEPVRFWPAPGIFFTGSDSGACSSKKYLGFELLKILLTYFLTRKNSFISK